MEAFIKELWKWPWALRLRTPNNDDEHVDRLNHRITVGIILCCVLVTTTSSFVFSRMSCWVPAELRRDTYGKYIEDYCWISNTYYIHSNVTPPHSTDDRRASQISYYQWVPIILLLLALGFYAPRLFWRSFNAHCGIDIQNLINKSQIASKDSTKAATRLLDYYCHTFKSQRAQLSINLTAYTRRNKHRGNYLNSLYVLTRLMYLINSILQLILLNLLLGHRGNAWFLDIDIMKSILRYGNPLLDSPYFPRVTLCDVPIREIAEIHRYTVQCALPVNILNEKIFLALSFWFSYVILHNIVSFVILISQQFRRRQIQFIRHLIELSRETKSTEMERYVFNFLTYDGIFLLRLISHNSSELQAMKILQMIVDDYRKFEKHANE
ncbi:unnamed protein product [Adineta ricciae]|uniref:Innexin n=1 Tax=Adineta ricciae TaxID=249248 RepID=A0A813QHB8_ADIRI|nr:unnamed protein product [Adineta ricciae]CAF1663504.1 unnamed protein product [Adineta ricciae]